MNYSNNLKIINTALHKLLISEFKVPVKLEPGYNSEFSKGEYLSYWPTNQTFISGNSAGEDREYEYTIDYYFNRKTFNRIAFEDTLSDRLERLKQLLMVNRTYQPGDVYKWHDAAIMSAELLQLEDELDYIYYIHCEFNLKRFEEWS